MISTTGYCCIVLIVKKSKNRNNPALYMDEKMADTARFYSVQLGAETYYELPADGKFEAPNGMVITRLDLDAGAIYCKPLQAEVGENGNRQWVTISTK